MNNEEKILSALEALAAKVDRIEQGQSETNLRLNKLEQGQSETNLRLNKLEQGIADLKDYAEETRSATNRLLEWADNVEHSAKFPLPRL